MQDIPLDDQQQREVITLTGGYIYKAGVELEIKLDAIDVLFDLRGRSAGMYRVSNGSRCIRYNPWLFAKYYTENLATTVPHEVAHYAVDVMYGISSTRPHGREWKSVMQMFGANTRATCNYDLSEIPLRRIRRFPYQCSCRSHELTIVRHNRIQRGARYYCRNCKRPLYPAQKSGIMGQCKSTS